jgi:predicted O-methyltransferase YrrM
MSQNTIRQRTIMRAGSFTCRFLRPCVLHGPAPQRGRRYRNENGEYFMIKGLVTDGKIPTVKLNAPLVSLDAIPEKHRTRFFNPGEIDALAYLLKDAKRILEIGCQNGRTAKAILSNRPDIEIYIGVDVPPGTPAACAVQKNETPPIAGELALNDSRFYAIVSKDGSAALNFFPDGFFDAVFIDGDHSEAAVLRDHETAFSVLRRGGLIVHHDYHSLGTVGVKKALTEMYEDGEKLFHVENTWLVYCNV